MEKWICKTCGTQFAPGENPPEACPICQDERQYIGYAGQQWTTLAQMQKDGFRNEFREHEPHLVGVGTTPTFAIGERALLLQTERENVLWDCMSLLDDETVAEIEKLGGLTAIAISHPHYYSTKSAPLETSAYPLSSPANAARVTASHQQARGRASSGPGRSASWGKL